MKSPKTRPDPKMRQKMAMGGTYDWDGPGILRSGPLCGCMYMYVIFALFALHPCTVYGKTQSFSEHWTRGCAPLLRPEFGHADRATPTGRTRGCIPHGVTVRLAFAPHETAVKRRRNGAIAIGDGENPTPKTAIGERVRRCTLRPAQAAALPPPPPSAPRGPTAPPTWPWARPLAR